MCVFLYLNVVWVKLEKYTDDIAYHKDKMGKKDFVILSGVLATLIYVSSGKSSFFLYSVIFMKVN